jgi:hypothetical protein
MSDPIEDAARAICEADPLSPAPDATIMWGMKRAKAWEPRAAILRQAIEAGLFCHPAKAWLAPRHMTDGMIEAIEGKVSHMDRSTDELVNFDFAQADRFWRTVREAHLKDRA